MVVGLFAIAVCIGAFFVNFERMGHDVRKLRIEMDRLIRKQRNSNNSINGEA